MIKSALEMCTKRLQKIGRYGQHKIQRWIVHMNKKKKDNFLNLEVLGNLDNSIDKLGVSKSWTKILRINWANYEGFGFIYKSHFILFSRWWSFAWTSCCHQRCCESVFNDAEMRMIKWALEVCTKRFPKIGRHGHHKIQCCSVHFNHLNKKQTIPQILKYWITSTMSWHWKANCNVENPNICFLLATIQICPFSLTPPPNFSAENFVAGSILQFKPTASRMLTQWRCAASRILGIGLACHFSPRIFDKIKVYW